VIQFYLLYQDGASIWLVQFHYTKDLKKEKIIRPKRLNSASFFPRAAASPPRMRAQPRLWRGWASERRRREILSLFRTKWLPN